MSEAIQPEAAPPDWFDTSFFVNSYLAERSSIDSAEAYDIYLRRRIGEKGLYCSAQNYIESNCGEFPGFLRPYISLISKSFDWQGYAKRNQDLSGLKPIDLTKHFLHYGLTEPRHWNPKASLLDRRFSWAIQSGSFIHLEGKLQGIVHCYHFDVLCYLVPYLRNIARLGGNLHILVANDGISSSAMDDLLKGLSTGAQRHTWRRVINYGEDWSSFHHAFQEGLFDEDGVTIKMQTKKSANLGADGGHAWIDEALSPICGTYSAIAKVLADLSGDQVVVQASQLVKRSGFGANEDLVTAFAGVLGLQLDEASKLLPFSGGSMFAARNQAIRDFFMALGPVDYSLRYSDNSYCGRYAGHALERLFFYFCHLRYQGNSTCWVL